MTITFKATLTMFFVVCTHAIGQTSFWPTSAAPITPYTNDKQSVTLGLKFSSDIAGFVTGVRFYKGVGNTGTHIGNLWSSTGTKLGSVTFTAETASGWQQATFPSPISIAANTTYVISYTAPNGAYAETLNYPWSTLNVGTLHAVGSSSGVYVYGTGTLFPTSAWNNCNYWVDVSFSQSTPSSPSTYIISGNTDRSGASIVLSGTASASTTTDGSGAYSFPGLANGQYVVAPSLSGYTFNPPTAVITISNASNTAVNFTSTATPAPIQHSVVLSWTASTSTNLKGYYVYRAATAGEAFTKINALPVAGTMYTDNTVASGRTYYYTTTAVNADNLESGYSNQAAALVPTP